MSFMQAELTKEPFAIVETAHDSFEFPADLVRMGKGRAWYRGRKGFAAMVRAALEFTPEFFYPSPKPADVRRIIVRDRWASRLTAPGYMDCTDWNTGASADEVLQSLYDQFGDECETAGEIALLSAEHGTGAIKFEECGDEGCEYCERARNGEV